MRSIVIYGILLAAATLKIFSMPVYSFDGYLYSYLVSGDVKLFKSIRGLPPEYVSMSDETYVQQAPYYKVKLLYVALVRLATHFAGILRAPYVVSAAAYFLLGWSVWLWLGSLRVDALWRTLASVALMFSSVVTDTARMGTPDLLCTLLLVAGAWLVLSTKYYIPGAILLVMSIFGRQDSLILAGLLLGLAYWQQKAPLKITVLFSVIMLACNFVVGRFGYPYHQLLAWTLRTSYWHALIHNFAKTEIAIYGPFLLLAFIAIKRRFQMGLLGVCAGSLVIRHFLMPHWEIRYLLPQALMAGVIAAAATLGVDREKKSAEREMDLAAS